MRTFRRSRWLFYVMSLCVLGSAAWFPVTIMAQVLPGSPFESSGSGGGATYPVSDEVFKIADDGDPTKLLEFELSGMTTANTVPIAITGTATAPSIVLPNSGKFIIGDIGLRRGISSRLQVATSSNFIAPLHMATPVEANAATKAPSAEESLEVYTNEGDADGSIINLPTAATGLTYTVYVQANQTITVNASAGDTIRIAASVSGAAGLISSNTVGNSVTLVAINTTEWVAIAVVGTWTVT